MSKKPEPTPLDKWLAGYDRGVEACAFALEQEAKEYQHYGAEAVAVALLALASKFRDEVKDIREAG